MRYDDNDDGPPPRFGPAGAHRGLPLDPPGFGAGLDDGYDDDAAPPSWPTDDGYVLAVPATLWGGWRAPYQPWRFRRRRPRLGALGGLARRSTRIGTLRSRRSGAAFPVFGATAGGRRWGLVTRPRRELEAEVHEIVAVRPAEELEFGVRPSPEPIPALPAPPARPGTTADGWRLRLPHQGLHSILSRLRPDDLAKLAGGSLPADPAPTVVRSVARLTAQSRRRGSLRSRRTGQRMELFEAPGYSLLVRPAGEMQGEIVAVRAEGESEIVRPNDREERKSFAGSKFRVRGARAVIDWQEKRPLADLMGDTKAGAVVYVITRKQGGRPVYVGQSGNFSREWGSRFRILTVLNAPLQDYYIYLGTVKPLPDLQLKDGRSASLPWKTIDFKPNDPTHLEWLRQDVEHVLYRWLWNNGHKKLENASSKHDIWIAPLGIKITHKGATPTFFQNFSLEPREKQYEIPGEG
jgi:hypothetical protein